MDSLLFDKVLNYVCYVKCKCLSNSFISDKVLYKKMTENFIINKFLHKWMDDRETDPMDIIDDMLLKYWLLYSYARQYNDQPLQDLYITYIKALENIRDYIRKEQKL